MMSSGLGEQVPEDTASTSLWCLAVLCGTLEKKRTNKIKSRILAEANSDVEAGQGRNEMQY